MGGVCYGCNTLQVIVMTDTESYYRKLPGADTHAVGAACVLYTSSTWPLDWGYNLNCAEVRQFDSVLGSHGMMSTPLSDTRNTDARHTRRERVAMRNMTEHQPPKASKAAEMLLSRVSSISVRPSSLGATYWQNSQRLVYPFGRRGLHLQHRQT